MSLTRTRRSKQRSGVKRLVLMIPSLEEAQELLQEPPLEPPQEAQ